MPLLGQMARYGIVGLISSLIYAAVYLPLATHALPKGWAVLAVPPAFLVAAAVGFLLHSRWSFKNHTTGVLGRAQHYQFLGVQASGMGMNSVFTWLITGLAREPAWVALVPCVTVTPLVTFWVHRNWVFR